MYDMDMQQWNLNVYDAYPHIAGLSVESNAYKSHKKNQLIATDAAHEKGMIRVT